jgi:methylphosphotriester-DNA--protein-cysteine methyltransferase
MKLVLQVCAELVKRILAIADIALQVGFSSQSHFTQCFKRFIRKGTGSLTGDEWLKALLDMPFEDFSANWLKPL